MSIYSQLSEQERYTITAGLISRRSIADIAKDMNRHPSTIYRELRRNRTHHDDGYRALIAHSYATARLRRERRGYQHTEAQWTEVISLLRIEFSPEQISAELRKNNRFSISHETIYKYIIKDKKRGGCLYMHLRGKTKRHRKRCSINEYRGIMPHKRNISTRPAGAENRSRLGHWEGDTVIGAGRHHGLVTLTERKTGFAVIIKIKAKTSAEINRALRMAIRRHPKRFKTITFDNGSEFHGYEDIEARFPVTCYFANPYHSWERGSNENMNGLIRQYLPKKMSMENVTQEDCDRIADQLNSRPRKRYGFVSPKELFYAN